MLSFAKKKFLKYLCHCVILINSVCVYSFTSFFLSVHSPPFFPIVVWVMFHGKGKPFSIVLYFCDLFYFWCPRIEFALHLCCCSYFVDRHSFFLLPRIVFLECTMVCSNPKTSLPAFCLYCSVLFQLVSVRSDSPILFSMIFVISMYRFVIYVFYIDYFSDDSLHFFYDGCLDVFCVTLGGGLSLPLLRISCVRLIFASGV